MLIRGQNDAVFRALLADRAIRKIILVRRNRIQTFISERIALRTGEWESYEFSDHRPFRCRLHVEAAELRAHVAANDRYYGAMRDLLGTTGQVWLEIAYEDLAGRASQRRLLHYLGVRSGMAALRPATRKVSADDLRDVVTNHAELAAELAGSGLEADLKGRQPLAPKPKPSGHPGGLLMAADGRRHSIVTRNSGAAEFTRHRVPVTCVAWVPGTRQAVTSGYDGAVGLFHLDTGAVELLGYHAHLVNRVTIDRNGTRAASSSSDYQVHIGIWSAGA
jgi:hypothetical protein